MMDLPPTIPEESSLEIVFPNGTYDHRRKSSMASPTLRRSVHERIAPYFVHSLLSNREVWVGNDSTTTSPTSPGPGVSSVRVGVANPELGSALSSPASSCAAYSPTSVESPGLMTPLAQSRQLTKKQLSGMAFTIRELAKTLSRIKLKPKLNNVLILVKTNDASLVPAARDLTVWLLAESSIKGCNVYIEDVFRDNEQFDIAGLVKETPKYEKQIRFWNTELCASSPQLFDLVLALGGDGTVLYSSSLFQGIVPPVISFAMGSLGFLTKFNFDGFKPTLSQIFSAGMGIRLRLRLEATIMRSNSRTKGADQKTLPPPRDIVEQLLAAESDNEHEHTHTPYASYNILNEVVIDRGPNPTMTTLELFGDGYHYTTIQADGVCVATPTGSTAYNLAAGGSLCHPDNPVILVTAICAHTLSFRPIILPDSIVLRAAVPYDARATSWVSFDGRDRTELLPGDYVTVSASRFPYPSVLPQGTNHEDWIDSISRTLNWNSRTRQKPWTEATGIQRGKDNSSS